MDTYKKNLERQRRYKVKHRKKINAYQREYYKNNAEKRKDYQRAYRKHNREKINARRRKYRKHNREKIRDYEREYMREYRKRKKIAVIEAETVEVSTSEAQQKRDRFEELQMLAVPLHEWLLEHYDMMCKIMIEAGHVEVLRSELGVPMEAEGEDE